MNFCLADSSPLIKVVIARINTIILKDKKLSESIESLRIERLEQGCRLTLVPTQSGVDEVYKKLIWILRVANSCIPISELWLDGQLFKMQDLLVTAPCISKPAGKRDKKLLMTQRRQKSELLNAAIDALAEKYTVFLLSHEGRYEFVQFHSGTQSLIPGDELLGKFLHEIVGDSSAETILECMKKARLLQQPCECSYDVVFKSGERRWYEGKAYPTQGENVQLFTVRRVC